MTVGPVTSPTETQPVEEPPAVPGVAIEGRSLGRIAWIRLKRDKVAMTGGVVVILLLLVAVLAPVLTKLLGHPPNEFHNDKIDPNLGGLPIGSFGGMSSDFLFGVEPGSGRDVFSRILYGAQVSLMVGFGSALLSVVIGSVLGVVSGYFGGWVDTVISRTMDLLLAFPQLLFALALVSVMPDKVFGMSAYWSRLLVLIFVIGFFGWPYIGRIVRGQTLTVREREFIEASRSIGGRPMYIVFREILPNLVAPILVYATLIIPTNILNEAALSFLGVGMKPPTPSWGAMLSDAIHFYQYDPTYMVVPGLAIFITVLAFNLFGDGLRDALDPRGSR